MIPPEEALSLILENVQVLPEETVSLAEAADRVLAADLSATDDLPSFDNSAMDGFAVRTEDCAGAAPERPLPLKILDTLRAGALSSVGLEPGSAARIMTGAPIPKGADAVVMREATVSDGDGIVRILREPEPGEHIRRLGEDIRRGSLLLKKGSSIRPYEIALLAAQGITRVPVIRRARAAILATGDELVDPSEPLSPGRIRNSNGPAIGAAVSRWGAAPLPQGIAKDDPKALGAAFERALEAADVLLVSGGVSVGDFDFTKAILEGLGLEVVFWKAAIKPGKPLLFGLHGKKPVFGLPGNPVSVLVCLEEFVRPALERMQGHAPRHPGYHLQGCLENEYRKEEGRQQYLFCQASEAAEGFTLRVIRPQGSAMLGMASNANALAVAPIGTRLLRPGMRLAFRWLK